MLLMGPSYEYNTAIIFEIIIIQCGDGDFIIIVIVLKFFFI